MKRLFMLAVLACLSTSAATFAATPGGNLAWNDCHADGGASAHDFACGSNVGYESIVGSWVLTKDYTDLVGIEAFVDVYFDDATLPDWWSKVACPGRTMGTVGVDEPASLNQCVPTWSGTVSPSGVLVAYNNPIYIQQGVLTPGADNTAQFDLVGVADYYHPLTLAGDGREYFLFQLRIGHTKSNGAGSCTGCSAGGQMNLQGVWFDFRSAPSDHDYAQGEQATITFNHPSTTVATQNHTWGALKAMYR